MEERIIDQDELRKVRVTRTDGGLDVVDDTLPEDAVRISVSRGASEDERIFAFDGLALPGEAPADA